MSVLPADDVAGALARLSPGVVVDALFGTGLSRPLDARAGAVVDALARVDAPVLAVDLPSGLPTDGAAPEGAVVDADETITFGARKIAHVSEPGAARCGVVTVVDIGLARPPSFTPTALHVVDARWEPPDPLAHKGRFGHVGVKVGAPATRGAALLAAHAALRAGAGLVSLLVDDEVDAPPELMRRRGEDGRPPDLDGLDALVLGPGLGRDPATATWAQATLSAAAARGVPVVVDADALPALAASPSSLRGVATPHPGEAARLLGVETAAVQRDRLAAARRLVDEILPPDVALVLKGAAPIVARRGRTPLFVDGLHPSLATGGSGDVLAGAIGALLARGLSVDDAAATGAFAHQRAGAALDARAARGHLAREIADALPVVLDRR